MDDSQVEKLSISFAARISAIECVLEERFPGCIGQDVVADVLAPAADATAQPTGANGNGDEETAGSAGEGPGETASESEEEKEAENQEAQDEEAPEKGSQEVA